MAQRETPKETQAPMQQAQQPNNFELEGPSFKVTYSTTSIDGKPYFIFEDTGGVRQFRGNQIRVLESEIGRQVTVSMDQGCGRTVTLLIPIFVDRNDTSFTTWAIMTSVS
jgi:hypothetical protein